MTGHRKRSRTDPDQAVKARAEALFKRKQEQKLKKANPPPMTIRRGREPSALRWPIFRALRLQPEAKAGVKATAAPGKSICAHAPQALTPCYHRSSRGKADDDDPTCDAAGICCSG